MTKAGKKWAAGIYPGDLRRASIPSMAEFWIRAFCGDVEERAQIVEMTPGTLNQYPGYQQIGVAFCELKRELLVDKCLTENPIPLNEAQGALIKQWAADDRLWTTEETVEFNLQTFARCILKASCADPPNRKDER